MAIKCNQDLEMCRILFMLRDYGMRPYWLNPEFNMVTALIMEYVKPPEPLAFEEPNALQCWARWQKQFITYFTAAELSEKTKKV